MRDLRTWRPSFALKRESSIHAGPPLQCFKWKRRCLTAPCFGVKRFCPHCQLEVHVTANSARGDMTNPLFRQLHCMFRLIAFLLMGLCSTVRANSRILEVPLALSADPRSEFSTQFRLLSPGRLAVELVLSPGVQTHTPLIASIARPDRSEATRRDAIGPFRLEYAATEAEIDHFVSTRSFSWTVRVIQGFSPPGEVRGRLRITVPTAPRQLVDTQFTLLGSGNAQEIPFIVRAPGKIQVSATWETDGSSAGPTESVPLTLSLIHSGPAQIYARRQSRSPQRIEHQISEEQLNTGSRWLGRLQNDSQSKVKGSIQVIFVPAL